MSGSTRRGTARRTWYVRGRDFVVRALLRPQVVLAVKAALAAGVAWALALLLPGVAAEYPYYAPLGALLAIYPTVAGTVKLGLQTMVGLAIGIVLANVAVWAGDPDSFTVAFVVGMGVLLAGLLPRTAGGGTGIASAGLFVLIIGNNDLSFSVGYFIQMIVGVLVGLGVSTFIAPPLNTNDALNQMGALRRTAAQQLQDIGQALEENWAAGDPRWVEHRQDLFDTMQDTRAAVKYAEESRKGNLRRHSHPRNLTKDYEHVRALETVAFHTLSITNMLEDAVEGTTDEKPIPPALREPLQDAFTTVGKVLKLWTVKENDEETLEAAQKALRALEVGAFESASRNSPFGAAAAIAMSLHRILHAVTPATHHGNP
ncbi:FUSC family protein [Arthrobacter sp. H41]|uniref:FUSC family protein n=1 Tax=Arthrobacter sp. H41 TaxID=1312978 RepID=UPI0012DCB187|nr:FUSC family protein [Arthrobacter sp. H41]